MTRLSRREFSALAASAAAAPFTRRQSSASAPITARDLIDRIRKQINVEWRSESVDGIKAGEPSTIVTGVVTTSIATIAVLQQAVKAGTNFVITSQPVFYSRADSRTPPTGRGARGGAPAAGGATSAAASDARPPADPVFAAKNALVDKHGLVVFRLSEHWRLREPDPLALGMSRALGWTTRQSAGDPRRFDLPAVRLESLVADVKKKLQMRGGMRVVGDPRAEVRRVGLLLGSTPIQSALKLLPDVDVILAGEMREWESVEYARDTVSSGAKKALILLGRVASEEPGMNVCAEWLKTFVPEVPIRHISAGDPYWRPA